MDGWIISVGLRAARGRVSEIKRALRMIGGTWGRCRGRSLSELLIGHPQHLMATKAVPAVHSGAPLPVQLCLVHSLVAFQETDEFVEEANH